MRAQGSGAVYDLPFFRSKWPGGYSSIFCFAELCHPDPGPILRRIHGAGIGDRGSNRVPSLVPAEGDLFLLRVGCRSIRDTADQGRRPAQGCFACHPVAAGRADDDAPEALELPAGLARAARLWRRQARAGKSIYTDRRKNAGGAGGAGPVLPASGAPGAPGSRFSGERARPEGCRRV